MDGRQRVQSEKKRLGLLFVEWEQRIKQIKVHYVNQIVIVMFIRSERITSLLKNIVFYTKKSRRTTTPRPFNNNRLTPHGIVVKQPRSYDYQLPEDLPNRHLYWNRTEQNKVARKRMTELRMYKLKINPIHDENGNRLLNRSVTQIAGELGSRTLIKQSVGRTLENIYEAITRFKKQFVGEMQGKTHVQGVEWPVLKFALDEVHDRHLPTLNLYKFCNFCQLMNMSGREPTQSMLLHLFRHLEAMKVNHDNRIPIVRLAKMASYMFSRTYSQECQEIFYKKKTEFKLFEELEPDLLTFEDILPHLYTPEQIASGFSQISPEEKARYLKAICKMPGGKALVAKIEAPSS